MLTVDSRFRVIEITVDVVTLTAQESGNIEHSIGIERLFRVFRVNTYPAAAELAAYAVGGGKKQRKRNSLRKLGLEKKRVLCFFMDNGEDNTLRACFVESYILKQFF